MPPSPQNKYYSSKKEDVICYNNSRKIAHTPGFQLQRSSLQQLHADSLCLRGQNSKLVTWA